MTHKLEYVWLDGHSPEPTLRSKVKIIKNEAASLSLMDIPLFFLILLTKI